MHMHDHRSRYPDGWMRWFAWFPVEVPEGYVWLETVEYRWNKYPYFDMMGYVYRRITKEPPYSGNIPTFYYTEEEKKSQK